MMEVEVKKENLGDPNFEDFEFVVLNTSSSSAFCDEPMDSDDENKLKNNVSESDEPEQLVDTHAEIVEPCPTLLRQCAINVSTPTFLSSSHLATNPAPPPCVWSNVSLNDPGPPHTIPMYCAEKGPVLPMSFDADTEPIEYFQLFFNDEIIQHICNETNLFANKRKKEVQSPHARVKEWKDVNIVTMKAFLGSVINKGLIPLPSIEAYYTTSWEGRIPFFSDVFSKNEFMNIFWNLHFNHRTNQDPVPRGFLIEPILTHMKKMSKQFYTTGSHVTIEESTISFKGHVSFRVFNPNNPTKYGMKVFVVSDSENGYMYDYVPYFGSRNWIPNSKLQKTTQIVKVLSESVVMKDPVAPATGLHVYTNRYYTSPELAEELLKIGCLLTGTVMTNRTGMPRGLKAKGEKMKKGDLYAQRKGSTLVLSWKEDKRAVHILSTFTKGSKSNVTNQCKQCDVESMWRVSNVPSKWPSSKPPTVKPDVILDYIKHMRGIDRSEHFISSYLFMRRTKKWYRKIFFWLLEVVVIDAYLLYKLTQESRNEKPLSHKDFRKSLVRALAQEKAANRPNPRKRGRPVEGPPDERLDGKSHFMGKREKGSSRCVVCHKRGVRRETVYYCKTCVIKPGLHPENCFELYHSSQHF